MRIRAPKLLMRPRVDEILGLMNAGYEHWDLCEYVRKKEREPGSNWELREGETPMVPASIRRYMTHAFRRIRDAQAGQGKDDLAIRHIGIRRSLYAKAVKEGDLRTALTIADSEARMLDLFPRTDAEALAEITRLREEIRALRNAQAGTGDGPSGA